MFFCCRLCAFVLLAFFLSACGGGGGSDGIPPVAETPPPPVETPAPAPSIPGPPVLSVAATAQPSSSAWITVTSSETLLWGDVKVRYGDEYFLSGEVIFGSRVFYFASAVGLPGDATLQVTATAANTRGEAGSITATVHTPPIPGAWPPPRIVPMGEVTTFPSVETRAAVIGTPAWVEATQAGAVRFIDSGAVATGAGDARIVWAAMSNRGGSKLFPCIAMVEAATGRPVAGLAFGCQLSTTGSYGSLVGTPEGLVVDGIYLMRWNPQTRRAEQVFLGPR
jgi:hypothetical protein